jgi:hypothetical protein
MAPAFDANGSSLVGAGVASPDTFTYTHTFGSASAKLIAVWLLWFNTTGSTLALTTRTVTVGGQTCNFGAALETGGGTGTGNNVLEGYYLLKPPTSPLAQTVSVTLTHSGFTFAAIAESNSYTGVGGVGAAVTNSAVSASASSGAVASATGHLVAQAFGVNTTATTLSAYSGTSHFNNSATSVGTFAGGEAAGAASVTVTATLSGSDSWASVAFDMLPLTVLPQQLGRVPMIRSSVF